MGTFVFVRHAQGTHNLDYSLIGDDAYNKPRNLDAALTTFGHSQTEKARTLFAHQQFDVILCSPLRRCRETLIGIYPAAVSLPVVLDDRLMEPQGAHLCNRRKEKPELIRLLPAKWDLTNVGEANLYDAGVEKRPEFYRRIASVTEDICVRWPGKRILVVTHHMWIRHWHNIYYGIEVPVENCAWVVAIPPKKLITDHAPTDDTNSNNDNC